MELKTVAYHTRKADQFQELAGLALRDNDKADADKKFAEAREHRAAASELRAAGCN